MPTALYGFSTTSSVLWRMATLQAPSTRPLPQHRFYTLAFEVLLGFSFALRAANWADAHCMLSDLLVFASIPNSVTVHGSAGLVRLNVSALSHCNSLSQHAVELVAGRFCRKVRSCCSLLLLLLDGAPAECAVGTRPAHCTDRGFEKCIVRY